MSIMSVSRYELPCAVTPGAAFKWHCVLVGADRSEAISIGLLLSAAQCCSVLLMRFLRIGRILIARCSSLLQRIGVRNRDARGRRRIYLWIGQVGRVRVEIQLSIGSSGLVVGLVRVTAQTLIIVRLNMVPACASGVFRVRFHDRLRCRPLASSGRRSVSVSRAVSASAVFVERFELGFVSPETLDGPGRRSVGACLWLSALYGVSLRRP